MKQASNSEASSNNVRDLAMHCAKDGSQWRIGRTHAPAGMDQWRAWDIEGDGAPDGGFDIVTANAMVALIEEIEAFVDER